MALTDHMCTFLLVNCIIMASSRSSSSLMNECIQSIIDRGRDVRTIDDDQSSSIILTCNLVTIILLDYYNYNWTYCNDAIDDASSV